MTNSASGSGIKPKATLIFVHELMDVNYGIF